MEALALKYRPRTFDDLVGQRAVQVVLRQMVIKRKVPSALLFDGARGTGKTTTARILAASLNCETPPGPCGHCVSCKSVFDGTSLDVVEIDAASNGLVDDIRQLRHQVLYSVGGNHRVVILDEAHSMSTAAFNALLKTIEEPPPGTVFVLLTTEPGRILDTVLSRCMPFTFRRISTGDIVARLTQICANEGLDVEPALLTVIADRADGGLRDAIMALDQVTRAGIVTVDAYAKLTGEVDYAPALLTAIAAGDYVQIFGILDEQMARTGDAYALTNALVGTLCDLLVLRCGGTIAKQGEAEAARGELATRLSPTEMLTALRILWDLKTKVAAGDDPRTILALAVTVISDALTKNAPKPEPAAPRKLSLADMKQMGTAR